MYQDTNNLPTLKEIEATLFRQLQSHFQVILTQVLEELDIFLMENRDHKRLAYHEKQACTMDTLFGPITIDRRKYVDRKTSDRVALLDRTLEFEGSTSLSPLLTEIAVEWAVKGPSYRDAKHRLEKLLGYPVISHEQIRQKVLQVKAKKRTAENTKPKQKEVLFLEVDGLHAALQQSEKSSHEIKVGIVHEGWDKRHPKSSEYELVNKSYVHTLDNGDTFWETFSRELEHLYTITEDTYVIINGDGAPWIRAGVDYFRNARYVYNHYHLKKWVKQALANRSKQERQRVYEAYEAYDPSAMLAAIAEAEKAETDVEKKQEIATLREFVLEHQEAFQDYRVWLEENGIHTTGMRPMGAAESNMNLLSKRLKQSGYSWSLPGLGAMVNALFHQLEGSLADALKTMTKQPQAAEDIPMKRPHISQYLKQKTRESVGALSGRIPVLAGHDQNKPYAHALRGLTSIVSI